MLSECFYHTYKQDETNVKVTEIVGIVLESNRRSIATVGMLK